MTPSYVVCRADEVPPQDAWLSAAEQDHQRTLVVPKRRSDWRLGRFAAKRALMSIGRAAAPEQVGVIAADDGAPEVWLGKARCDLTISITHRDEIAVVAVLDSPVGCDLEIVEPRSSTFVDDFFTEAERAAMETDLDVALYWSAKESLLKCIRCGLRRDTRSVEVQGVMRTTGWSRIEVEDLERGHRYPGWWRTLDAGVLTLVTDTPTDQPKEL